MNAIRSVFNALGNLANAIDGLADILDNAGHRLRQQLALDGDAAPVLDHKPAGDNAEHAGTNGAAKGRKARAGA